MMKPTTVKKTAKKAGPVVVAIREAKAIEIYAFARDGKRLTRVLALRRPGARGQPLKIGMTTIDAMKNRMIAIARGARKPGKGAPKLWITPRALGGALASWCHDSVITPEPVEMTRQKDASERRTKGVRRSSI